MIAGGDEHVLYLDSAGALWACGYNGYGQLGQGNTNDLSLAGQIRGLPPCVWIACGANFSACVARDGRLFCWGQGSDGQLGQGNTRNHSTPQHVAGLPPIRSVSCGGDFTMALAHDGTLWAFGNNDYGQLGFGDHSKRQVKKPAQVEGITAQQVACGTNHSMSLGTDGALYAWGGGEEGQLGTDDNNDQAVPTRIDFPHPIKFVSCGGHFSMVISTDGSVWTTGSNYDGRLGLKDTTNRNTLHKVEGVSAELGGSCGYSQAVVLDAQERLWAWGYNCAADRQTEIPEIIAEGCKAAQATIYNVFAQQNHQILVSGDNSSGQLWLGFASEDGITTFNDNLSVDMLSGAEISTFCETGMEWEDLREALDLSGPEKNQLQEVTDLVQQLAQSKQKGATVDECAPSLSLASWQHCADLVIHKKQLYDDVVAKRQELRTQYIHDIQHCKKKISQLETALADEHVTLKQLQDAETRVTCTLQSDKSRIRAMAELTDHCITLAANEEQRMKELQKLLSQQSDEPLPQGALATLSAEQMDLVWWRMGLHGDTMEGINGKMMLEELGSHVWTELGLSVKETGRLRFMAPMMNVPNGLHTLAHLDDEDCVVCCHHSVPQTINLMKERGIKLDAEEIQREGWTTPELIYAPLKMGQLGLTKKLDLVYAMNNLRELREAHEQHLSELSSTESTSPTPRPQRRHRDERRERGHSQTPYERPKDGK